MSSIVNPSGPLVMLASADSVFTVTLAKHWLSRGMAVKVVTLGGRSEKLPAEVEVVDVRACRSYLSKMLCRIVSPAFERFQKYCVRRNLERYQSVTGKRQPDEWEWNVLPAVCHSRLLSTVALAFRPRFVFGQEAFIYGPATAYCSGVTRILFPWGSDIYNTPESWWGAERLVRWSLRNVDLIVPSSSTAKSYLSERFGVDGERVEPVSWGVDLSTIAPLTSEDRRRICEQNGIPDDVPIVFNARRFRRQWGSEVVLSSFLKVATLHPRCHFVLLSGPGGQLEASWARDLICASGLGDRFRLIDHEVDVGEYNSLASLADVFVSVMCRGDMRSSSVLQCAAAGAAPVIGHSPEYRYLAGLGFSAELVDSGDPTRIGDAVVRLLSSEAIRRNMAEKNLRYIVANEDRVKLLDLMLEMCLGK